MLVAGWVSLRLSSLRFVSPINLNQWLRVLTKLRHYRLQHLELGDLYGGPFSELS